MLKYNLKRGVNTWCIGKVLNVRCNIDEKDNKLTRNMKNKEKLIGLFFKVQEFVSWVA